MLPSLPVADQEELDAEDGRIPNKKWFLFMTFVFTHANAFSLASISPATVARAAARTEKAHSDLFHPCATRLHAMR